jgi:hypothetical protein
MESLENVWTFCTSNGRICPIPKKWNELYQLLKNKKQNPNGSWEPPLPPILGSWYDTPYLFKLLVFRGHIEWANNQDQITIILDFLKSLKEEEWFHYGE